MCGISGIINKSGQPVSNALIENITNLVFHRGPDGSDYFHHSNISLGHRRLSIIDLSEDGKQPMHYLNRYTITYNGEIFNYIELRNELKTYGYSFNTASDTEVILAAYDKWKDDCPNKLNGMWAFAIFDKEKKILFCSRDRYGIKPFYFINSTEYFSFGSEIKQLLPFISKRKVNNKILADYLLNDLLEHSNETFFEEIFKLPTANNLIYNLNDSTYIINQYYTIKHINEYSKLNLKDACELYKEKFSESVKLRLRSDVKVGTCLSGGLDSSSVASVASKLFHENSSEKFMAVTAKSQESETDETYFAQLVAKNAMLDYNELFPNETQFSQTLDKVISLQEEPFISPSVFMQYFVFEKAKQLGCIVMLDGQGGDETLLGYERHYVSHFLNSSPALLLKELYLASAHSKLSLAKLFSYYLYFSLDFPKKLRPEKLFPYVKKPLFESANWPLLKESTKAFKTPFQLQKIEIEKLQLPALLRFEDKNSMYHSIESRLPFLDHHLLDYSVSLNSNHKIHKGWSKYILRKSMENILPKEIVWRKNKFAFNAPDKKWMQFIDTEVYDTIHSSNILNSIIDFKKLKNQFEHIKPREKWKLYNIAKWEKLFDVN